MQCCVLRPWQAVELQFAVDCSGLLGEVKKYKLEGGDCRQYCSAAVGDS